MNNYNYFDPFNYTFMGNNYDNNAILYGPYEGYLKGNMFKNLYEQYKNYKIATIKPKNEQEQDLFNLNQIMFAMHDVNLYLDVHPDNQEMLNLFTKYKDMYNDLCMKYEQKYGPINVNKTDNRIPFKWESTIFPWEVR